MFRIPSRIRYRYSRRRWHVLCAVVDAVGWAMFRLLELVRPRRTPRGETAAPESILVVQLDHLGDALLSTGLLAALRQSYPAAAIDVLAAPWNRQVFDACPTVDRVHVSRVNRFARAGRLGWLAALLGWGWRLRRLRRYDLAIDVRGELPFALLMWLAGAKRRLGWAAGGGGFWLTDSAAHVPGRPEAASRQALLDLLGIAPPPGEAVWPPRFDCGDAARKTIAADPVAPCDDGRPLVVLHVGAGTQAKRWPVEYWRALVGRLIVEGDARVALLGGEEDVETARSIAGPRRLADVCDRTGRYSLAETAALIERAALFVGPDSGPAHLAAAVGTPVVAIFSGTNDPLQWRPWGSRVEVVRNVVPCSPCHRQQCPLADHPCMRGLTPAAALAAVERLLVRGCAAETLLPSS